MDRVVLFLCTGNYYRSRFAEELFNARAEQRGCAWRAESAGLAPKCFLRNPGPISRHAIAGLRARGITVSDAPRTPREVELDDFERAARVIALCEREHRSFVERRGELPRPVEYWQVEDLPRAVPEAALATIEQEVERLLDELEAGYPAKSSSTSPSSLTRSSVE